MAKTTKSAEIDVINLRRGEMTMWLLGDTPFYCNRLQEKAKRELLYPRGRLTTAQRATHLKHDPVAEYRGSPYLRRGVGETRIMMVASAPKKALAQAAIDMPTGVARAQINRLVYMPEEYIPIWGIPRLAMDVVRQADISRTPDIRTRVRIDHWASRVVIRYAEPMLNESKVATLLSASGMLCGIGDWRQEKGGGSYGLYHAVSDDDPALLEIIRTGGMEAQDEALANPVCANAETEDLLTWFLAERERRGVIPEAAELDEDEAALEIPASLLLNGGDNQVVA
jgi:hypothetical protein